MKIKLKPLPQEGQRRMRSFFAWFPITVNNTFYWLEKLEVAEEYFNEDVYHQKPAGWYIIFVLEKHPIYTEWNAKVRKLYT